MDIQELTILSINALRRNLARTLLTMLGIIIGIGSVITIMSLGAGSTESIVSSISSYGANVLTVSPGKFRRGPGGSGGTFDTLTAEDAEEIEEIPNVRMISKIVNGNKIVTANSESTSAQIIGTDVNYEEIQNITLTTGSFFDQSDVLGASKDAVIGDEVIEELFGEDSEEYVIGETVRIDGRVFQIVGVAQESSSIIIPISTAQTALLGQTYLNSINVYLENTNLVDQTTEDIENILLISHDIENSEDADFSVQNSQSFLDTISSVTGTLTAMLSGIAAISLVVGGIGIMNIMLVTVTERTKEIGLLKAIGAKDKDILSQFLIEALVLTILGGIIGILLGMGVAFIASSFMSIPFIIKLSSILVSFVVSASIGILFGYYPAQKAAKLNPIDALRYE